MDHPFRSAAFGGFNRQDVLDFLENSSKQANQRQEELQKELEELERQERDREAEMARLREQADRLERESGELRAQLQQTERDLVASRARCGEKSSALEAAGRELEGLRARVAELEPDAAAYNELKERTAGVELEAHRRAQAIQEEAERQAEALRARMREWLARVEREYDALRTQVETTVSHAADQLDRAGKCLERTSEILDGQDGALEALEQICRTDGRETGSEG